LTKNTVAAIIPIAPVGQAVFGGAASLAISPNGGFAYAAYGNASTVSVINTSTNLTSAMVPVGLDTAGLAVAPDGSSVYVLADDLGGIAVINTATNRATLIVTPNLGSPGNLAFAPDGSALYVIDDASSNLEVVDPKTGDITNSVTPANLGVFDALAVSPDGHQVYVGTTGTDGISGGIVVVDTTIPEVINTIQLPNEPAGFAFSPDGTVAYAAVPDSGDVSVIDTGSMSVTATIPIGVGTSPTGVAVSADGKLLYVADSNGGETAPTVPGFFVIDVATAQVIDSTPTLGSGPSVLALTVPPTGLCVGDAQGKTVVTIDEILGAVNAALNGCPGRFPAMSTLTR
ncbi:MAG TPA: YncE family protein, partial [Candidatus Acidoferrales bacterium]|nr:YncE family protein [Candidatus Acidoferrales bacterium]